MHKYQSNSSICFYWCFAFFIAIGSLYGPKLKSFIDISVSAYAIGFILLLLKRRVKINKDSSIAIAILMLFFLYTLAVSIVTNIPNYFPLLRSARSIIGAFCLSFIFYTLTSDGYISPYGFIKLILFSLSILSVITLLQILFPSSQLFFSEIYGFNKSIRDYRAFGLTAGYDSAGFLSAFTSIFALALYIISKKRIGLIIFAISAIAVVFTSRSSMALFFGLFLTVFFFLSLKSLKFVLRFFIPIVAAVLLLSIFVLPIYLSTFTFFNNFDNESLIMDLDYTRQYAKTNIIEGYYERHWNLPKDYRKFLFGTGEKSSVSDVGYIQMIEMGGVVSLLFVVFFYSSYYWLIRSKVKNCLMILNHFNHEMLLVLYIGVSLFYLVMIIGNLKNLYFLTRGYHELFLILSSSALGFCHYFNLRRFN